MSGPTEPVDEPLVLLPGMNCSARLWSDVETGLSRRMPGLRVQHRPLQSSSIDAGAHALLDTLPQRFALAGLSLGAIVAMAMARIAPERVTRLCLMATNPYAPTSGQRQSWQRLRQDLAAGRAPRDIQHEMLPILLAGPARTPNLDERVLRMADETGSAALDRQLASQATRIDERPALRRVSVPTLLLAGGDDALCPVAKHEEMHQIIEDSRLAVLPGVGHLMTLEAPDTVSGYMAEWLSARRASHEREPSSPA